jgi:hypothetical protein
LEGVGVGGREAAGDEDAVQSGQAGRVELLALDREERADGGGALGAAAVNRATISEPADSSSGANTTTTPIVGSADCCRLARSVASRRNGA